MIKIAERHDMVAQVFDDGSALLSSKEPGKPGAIKAALAALDMKREVVDGAVSVFAHA